MPRSSARWIVAIDASSSCGPQPNAQSPPPSAQAPKPIRVISRPVRPSCVLGRFALAMVSPFADPVGPPTLPRRALASGLHEPLEHREKAAVDAVLLLELPLHTQDRPLGELDRLREAVVAGGGDDESFAELVDGLMMEGVDRDARDAERRREDAPAHDLDLVAWVCRRGRSAQRGRLD